MPDDALVRAFGFMQDEPVDELPLEWISLSPDRDRHFGGAEKEKRDMSNRLFVGGLSFDTDDSGLRAAFEPYGEVREAKVIADRDTGRSRGFGFVTYANASEASSAIEAQNGATLDGRTLRVDLAQERNRGGGGRRGGY